MKFYIIASLSLLFYSLPVISQNTVKMSAVKGNNYGVAYSLPKTLVKVKVTYTKTTKRVGGFGGFYQFAERFLNISDPITADGVTYSIDRIEASIEGVVDKEKSYLVEFKSNTVAPFVTLSKDGLICAINSDYEFDVDKNGKEQEAAVIPLKPVDANAFLTEEILRAGSTIKQAELVAKKIYALRETRTAILTGEADTMPPDGEAYKIVMGELTEQEKALTELFSGSVTTETISKEFIVIPDDKNIDKKVLFRFSANLGVVDAGDLSGAPVYLSLTNKEPKEEVFLTPKEEKEMVKKFSKGIIYNIPSKAALNVTYNGKAFVDKECDIVQYGSQDVLTPEMFDNKKTPIKVIFYPELGAVKQIIQ